MVHVVAIVKKWGNSLAIVIPMWITKKLDLIEGKRIDIDLRVKERVDGFGLCRGAKPFEEEKTGHEEFW